MVSGGAAIPSPFVSSKITPLSPSLPPPMTSSPLVEDAENVESAVNEVALKAKTSMETVMERLRPLNFEVCIGAKE